MKLYKKLLLKIFFHI